MPTQLILAKGEPFEFHLDTSEFFPKSPNLAVAYAAAASSWAWTEQWYSNARSVIEQCDERYDAEGFKDPRLRSRQSDMLIEAAKVHMAEKVALTRAALDVADRYALDRNKIVHYLFAYCDKWPQYFIAFDPVEFRRFFRHSTSPIVFSGTLDADHGVATQRNLQQFIETGLLYDELDFKRITQQNRQAAEILRCLTTYCSPQPQISLIGALQLMAIEEVQMAAKAISTVEPPA